MTENGIEHTLTELKGGHVISTKFVEQYMIPFFSDALEFKE